MEIKDNADRELPMAGQESNPQEEAIMPAEYLESSRRYIRADMEDIAANFLKLGYHLYEVQRQGTYTHAGYGSVAEFAETEFGIKKSTCYNLIKLVLHYSRDGHSMYLEDKYGGFGYSQLVEMLPLEDGERGMVKPDMSIVQIREIKKFGSAVDRQEQEAEIRKYCDFVMGDIKPFSRANVKNDIAGRCKRYNYNSQHGMSFSPGYIKGEHYRYTPSSLLACIGEYVSFEEEAPEPVQTSGLDAEAEPPRLTFEEEHNQRYQTPLEDVLMGLLKNNIKNRDKVKAIIEYLNKWT